MSELQRVGAVMGGSGTAAPFTASLSGSQRVNDAHGRFMQAALEERLFSGGMGLTSINAATFTTATLGATCTPIVGVWNPLTNTKNLVILLAKLGLTLTALQATGAGPFAWAVSSQNGAISTGATPWNRRTLTQSGSVARVFAGVALTGLTNNLAVIGGSALGGGSASNAAFLGTAAAMQTQLSAGVEMLDGSLIIPPGGVLALLATTTPVAHSAVSSLIWEEVPNLP